MAGAGLVAYNQSCLSGNAPHPRHLALTDLHLSMDDVQSKVKLLTWLTKASGFSKKALAALLRSLLYACTK